MKRKVRQLLIENLKSGRYKQSVWIINPLNIGCVRLRTDCNHFSVLGVLCDMFHRIEKKGIWIQEQDIWTFKVKRKGKNYDYLLPTEVNVWSGVNGQEEELLEQLQTNKSFQEIQLILESNYEPRTNEDKSDNPS